MTGAARLVLYDQDCGVCLAFARAISTRGIAVAALDSPLAAVWLRDLPSSRRNSTFHVIDERGRRRSGGDGVPLVLRSLGQDTTARAAEALPGLTRIAYRALVRSRRLLSVALGLNACPATPGRSSARP